MQSTYDKIQYYKIGQRDKASIIAKLKTLLAKEEQVKLALLFGSLTRRDSIRDIDLAIHAEPELTFKEYLNLNAQIELELRIPVDLVEIAKAPASLKANILKNGTLIKGTKTQQHQLLTQIIPAPERCSE
jgi:predicted nucleotidyltransferase